MKKIFESEAIGHMMRKHGRSVFEGGPAEGLNYSWWANQIIHGDVDKYAKIIFGRLNRYARHYHFLARNKDDKRFLVGNFQQFANLRFYLIELLLELHRSNNFFEFGRRSGVWRVPKSIEEYRITKYRDRGWGMK